MTLCIGRVKIVQYVYERYGCVSVFIVHVYVVCCMYMYTLGCRHAYTGVLCVCVWRVDIQNHVSKTPSLKMGLKPIPHNIVQVSLSFSALTLTLLSPSCVCPGCAWAHHLTLCPPQTGTGALEDAELTDSR